MERHKESMWAKQRLACVIINIGWYRHLQYAHLSQYYLFVNVCVDMSRLVGGWKHGLLLVCLCINGFRLN